jgi:hypothetical protein
MIKLGIFGSGKVGGSLGAWAAAKGDSVAFTAKHEASAERAARAAGHRARALPLAELARECDLLLLTAPFAEIIPSLAPFSADLRGKILVDVSNPITPDHRALTMGFSTSGAEEIARRFPESQVVKAFNATFAEIYAARRTEIHGQKITVLAAGDHEPAKTQIIDLIRRLGFEPIDAGPLANARYLEPLSLLNIQLGRVLGLGTDIAFTLLRKT